jgi:nucleotide-binding universal stress UspA family protein
MDGSKWSLDAAKYAIAVTKKNNAELIAIHILTPSGYEYMFDMIPASTSTLEELMGRSNQEVKSWMNGIKEEKKQQQEQTGNTDNKNSTTAEIPIKTDVILAVKSIAAEIVDYAEQENIDLIIIGTKGRSRLKKMLLGSVALGVVTYAHCPVMVVK